MASTEPPDDLHDAALAEDIALLGDIMAAAAADGGRALSDAEVDEALGLAAQDSAAERARSRRRRRRLRSRRVKRARKR
ncbi:MAG: hypothetical protein ACXV5Q_16270 [Frankiaceae bacterium]